MKKLKLLPVFIIASVLIYCCNPPSNEASASSEDAVENDPAIVEAERIYKTSCAGCHGAQVLAFAGHRWKHGKEADNIFKSIKFGYPGTEMISWESALSDDQINNLTKYIRRSIEEVERYGFEEEGLESDTFKTELLSLELDTIVSGMVQPILYWVPSIAPSGATFVTTDKYPGWEGDFLAGSLRFKYFNRCIVEGDKIIREEPLLKSVGRLRNVRIGPDGYIYIAVEEPGYIFRLMPITDVES